MTAMRAAVWKATDQVEVTEVPRPDVPPGWALVKIAYNGICGTDLSILHGRHPRAQAPLIMGHEMSGWVEVAGATGPPAGTLVIVEPLISCGACKACRDGLPHVCRNLGLYGIDAPGGMAQFVALPPQVLHAVPDGVDPRTATLAEPLAVAVHAVDLSGMAPGDVVAVYGAGPIGILTALVARHAGASTVVITEPSPWRREVAARLGFTVVPGDSTMAATLEPLTDGEGADTTFDSAAHPTVAAELTATTRVRGRIVVVGVYKAPAALDLQAVCFKEQTVVGVRVYTSADVARAIELIATDALDLGRFPTKAFDLTDVGAAFDAATSGQDCLKVLLTPLPGKADV
ncbi:zinc-dependent alcohol dehydrogenase [Pengzhenrongella sp.]|jgi:2-desacetyl-2-hydroxyethyl bacteriochlorophyllide A dehydrogenase|uniref:zinc-dependent alcohol dehydrogenase n=1 Tax=Pengzhenrongella sp. TaxID=2888820 RepID=UPI002F95F0E9